MTLPEFSKTVLAASGSPAFETCIKQGLEQLDPAELPLQQGLSGTSIALHHPVEAMVIGTSRGDGSLEIRAGLFYAGILSGCSCADDPTAVEAQNEYCEIVIRIDARTGHTEIDLARNTAPEF